MTPFRLAVIPFWAVFVGVCAGLCACVVVGKLWQDTLTDADTSDMYRAKRPQPLAGDWTNGPLIRNMEEAHDRTANSRLRFGEN